MEIHRITNISIAPPRQPDLNDPSSLRAQWEIVLDGGRKVRMTGNHIGGLVPVAGEWIHFVGGEPHVFQLWQVTEVRGDRVFLSNGDCLDRGGLYRGTALPVAGDYLERRTDGVHVIRQRYFEEKNASLIVSVKEAEATEKQRNREAVPAE